MPSSLGTKAASGAVWATIDRFGTMILQFVVNLIMARLLLPADFGAVGMLTIFIAVSQVLIDGGFASALIQKKYPTQTDFSTIFYWNLGFSTFLYLILFLCAPAVAEFFSMPILNGILRGIGLNLIITSVLSIQITRLRKQLAFRTIALTQLSSYIAGSTVAILMALYGFGVWSLVAMQLCYGIIAIIILWIITRWSPSLCFSRSTMKELFGFGGYIMAANLLQEFCRNLQGLIIGRKFSATQMGYFSQAYKLDQITSYSIPQVIVQVMYPVYSSLQDDHKRLNEIVTMNMRVISFLVFPLIGFLIFVAEPLIVFLYGTKWLLAVPYFQILCVGGFFVCLQNVNFYAVAAVGKSRSLFKWSFYKWGFLLVALLTGMNFGMYGILWGMVLSNLNIFIVNAYLASKNTDLSVMKQISSIGPISTVLIISIIIGFICSFINLSLVLTGIIFLLTFFLLSFSFNLQAIADTKIIINRILKRNS